MGRNKASRTEVCMHSDLPSNPTPANFEQLKTRPVMHLCVHSLRRLKSLVRVFKLVRKRQRNFLLDWRRRGGTDASPVGAFWTDVLTARTKSFVSSGMSGQPPYDHAGPSVWASDEVNGLLREQGKIPISFPAYLERQVLGAARIAQAGIVSGAT